ncbi:MAG: methyltransferase, partial [Gammaproteobacteria bacterium]|nr:methyltransferase [Gammaproteobacteria bacterium]
MRTLLISLAVLAVAAPAQAQFRPEPLTPIGQKIEAALKSDIRSAEEKERDQERRPRQTLEFFGLRDDMRVVELLPAGGWYTKILAQVLADRGELYVAIGAERQIGPMVKELPAMSRVKIAQSDEKLKPAGQMGFFELGEFSLGVTDADLVLTFRNLHNFTGPSRANLHKAVFKSLKSGGHYGVVDHTRRHNEPETSENWRRMDPVLAIKEIQAAGFVLVDYSNVHYRPDDELRYEVGRKTVTGNTDRF